MARVPAPPRKYMKRPLDSFSNDLLGFKVKSTVWFRFPLEDIPYSIYSRTGTWWDRCIQQPSMDSITAHESEVGFSKFNAVM